MAEINKPKDWQKIRDAGYAAKLSYVYSQPDKYADKQELIEQLHQNLEGYTFQQVRDGNVFALLATPPSKDKPAFVAFAGSDDMRDWKMDFTAIPTMNHGNHLGFETMYNRINPKEDPVITRFIENMEQQGVCTYVSGHSMGGALATLCGQQHGDTHDLNIVTLNAPTTGLLSTKHINTLEKLNITNFVKRGDFVSMGGTGSLAGDTYVIEDIPIGQSFMVTHERMDTGAIPASKRFVKNVMDIALPKHNPISAHSSDNMLSYIEALAERNLPIKGVMARISDEESRPPLATPKAPLAAPPARGQNGNQM